MVRQALVVAIVTLGLMACGPTPSPSAAGPGVRPSGSAGAVPDPAVVGLAFVDALARGDTAAAEAMEDETMRAAAPAPTLGALWAQLTAQFGAFGGLGGVETSVGPSYTVATVEARFATSVVPLLVTVTADGRVAGFHLGAPVPAGSTAPGSAPSQPAAPATASPAPSPAAYVRPDAFTETEVTVGSAPWALPGTLAMPKGDGPVPAIVLVAGSGPQDRDETIGPNAPLRDIAQGLASDGIAVLRYDKRTKTHAAAMAADVETITVREEVIEDALAAVDLLRSTPGIDPERVFVAGHSLGGYLAPRIAAGAAGTVAGIAMLEANSSPLQRLIADQLAYRASDAGGADPVAAAMLEALPPQIALVESAGLSPSTPAASLPLGIPAAYWLDLRTYDPASTAAGLSIPIFLAQGGRDYQVSPSELLAWRDALAGHDDVTIREYPALNHLLMAGSGPSRPAEYAVPGHVDAQVVADLAAWVRGERS